MSPFIVESFVKYERPYAWPVILAILSTVLNYELSWALSPKILVDSGAIKVGTPGWDVYWEQIYEKMYTRMTPYLTGMYAAYVHYKDDGTFHESQSAWLEWTAFVIMLLIGTFLSGAAGVWASWPAPLYYIYFNIAR